MACFSVGASKSFGNTLVNCVFIWIVSCAHVNNAFVFVWFLNSEEFIRECNWFICSEWLKACCWFCFRYFGFVTSFCSKLFSLFLLDEILSAFFRRKLKESINFFTKLSSSFDGGMTFAVGYLLKWSVNLIFFPAMCSTEKMNCSNLSTHRVKLLC